MTAPLLDRVRKACSKNHGMSAEALSVLREEVAKEAERADIDAADAQRDAVKPFLSESEIAEGKEKAEELAFTARRLVAALEYLDKEIEAQKHREEEAEKLEAYSEARRLRDLAATNIRNDYPGIQKALLKLQQDIGRARLAVKATNASLPEGCEPLDMPEGVAFGYPDGKKGRVTGCRPAWIFEMLVPDLRNWACPSWPPKWNGYSAGRIGEQELDGLFARGNKK